MNLWSNLLRIFDGEPAAPRLRNKPGGLAYINSRIDEGDGAHVLVNQVVRTVRLSGTDFWVVDPAPAYLCLKNALNTNSGQVYRAGDRIRVFSIKDESLTPIRGIGDHERSQELEWQPTVPASTYDAEKHAASYPGY